ncbi:hypothetical protein [Streptomyces gobiensis]|uniref:hypothetical protein n=1 Tax=Streptomyces gobiensis TaxID=2875706 RepID=UPI001E631910|nr:hypothetical protein [Streptomyces gobiensis]UGY94810.1 hypothetical protein test1122_25795 [Streptomyces gobiensis]
MPLHAPPAPAPALRSVLAALGSPTAVRGARIPPALRAARGTLKPELPLPVHVLTAIAGSGPSPRTRLTGWRFLLRGSGAAVGTAETTCTADGWVFSQFGEGPYVASTENALRRAESLTASYQPRLLSVPELYMLTLWLHADTEADAAAGVLAPADLLVPLSPAPPGIAPDRQHRVDGLLPLLIHRVTAPLLRTPA